MKKRVCLLFVCILSLFLACACTDKAKKDADKLTNDIVDYSQNQVDSAVNSASQGLQELTENVKDYLKEQAGDLSEKIVEGLTDAAKNVKDEAEDFAGEIKDDLSDNVGNIIDDVKDNIEDSISGAKDDIKDAVKDAVKDDANDDANDDAKVTDEPEKYVNYRFRNYKLLDQHYEKHGIEMGFKTREDYEKAASDVINNPNALHKTEKEDNDYVYYVEETNEFVILSTDGYIRTYFLPSGGKKYYDRQ